MSEIRMVAMQLALLAMAATTIVQGLREKDTSKRVMLMGIAILLPCMGWILLDIAK